VHTEIKYTEHASPFYSCFGTLHQVVYNSQCVPGLLALRVSHVRGMHTAVKQLLAVVHHRFSWCEELHCCWVLKTTSRLAMHLQQRIGFIYLYHHNGIAQLNSGSYIQQCLNCGKLSLQIRCPFRIWSNMEYDRQWCISACILMFKFLQ